VEPACTRTDEGHIADPTLVRRFGRSAWSPPVELIRRRYFVVTGIAASAGPDNVKWQGRRSARRLPGRGLAGGLSVLQVFRDPADNVTTACAVRTWRV